MSNKFDSPTLDNFYKYCKENPQAKEAVDTVIQAFSPDKIQTFLENCDDTPLPTDTASFEKFCTKYKQQMDAKKEAPKQETAVKEDKTVVAENTTVVAERGIETQKTAEKRKEIHDLLST